MRSNNTSAKFVTYFLGTLMLIAVVGGPLMSAILQNTNRAAQETPQPSETPIPTFPAPFDAGVMTFDQSYLHPSGLFSIAVPNPPQWDAIEPNTVPNRYTVTLRSQFYVVEAYVEIPDAPVATMDDLNNRFTEAVLNNSWSLYNNARATGREQARREDGDKLFIDFELTYRGQTYLARHAAWTDGEWVYVVRVVAPENARDQLVSLMEGVISSVKTYKNTTPTDWASYFDRQYRHIVRFPSVWTISDSAPGAPATITSLDGDVLRVEAQAGTAVTDEAAARAWLAAQRPSATVVSVQPISHENASGFGIAYSDEDVDGNALSGYAVVLNGADNVLHIANLRMPRSGVDLNAVQDDYALVMHSFDLLPTLDVVAPTPLPLPTFDPTLALTLTALPSSTPTAAVVATLTPQAPAEATAAVTAEADAAATSAVTAAP